LVNQVDDMGKQYGVSVATDLGVSLSERTVHISGRGNDHWHVEGTTPDSFSGRAPGVTASSIGPDWPCPVVMLQPTTVVSPA
jgi:hypothetical protein